MSDRPIIGLDNAAFSGRLRQHPVRAQSYRAVAKHERPSSRYVNDVMGSLKAKAKPIEPVATSERSIFPEPIFPSSPITNKPGTSAVTLSIVEPQPFVEPALPKQQRSNVLRRQFARTVEKNPNNLKALLQGYSRLQLGLIGLAVFVFIVGIGVSVQTFKTNRAAAAQIAALSKKTDSQSSTANNQSAAVPSTVAPSSRAISQYFVAPDLARYLKIPKLGVNTRVLQVGVTHDGSLGTPNNVFDAAWYTGSAKPGQAGATLIDGHVSSWTAHGVFYGLKKLSAGDAIQIVRGDGAVLDYRVVRAQVYDANNVDMHAAITPVTPGKPGLNLITCTGQIKRGTSEFNQRIIVFAEQV